MHYWIGVASKEHVIRRVQGGFTLVSHGKAVPLWIVYSKVNATSISIESSDFMTAVNQFLREMNA